MGQRRHLVRMDQYRDLLHQLLHKSVISYSTECWKSFNKWELQDRLSLPLNLHKQPTNGVSIIGKAGRNVIIRMTLLSGIEHHGINGSLIDNIGILGISMIN